MNTQFPLHPKRHLVTLRQWGAEPQDHQIGRNQYRADRYVHMLNPWIFRQLRSTERFNVTERER